MPIYDYECPTCGIALDVWAKVEEISLSCACGGLMERIITIRPPNVICDLKPYFDENLSHPVSRPHGSWVESRAHRRKLMQELGLKERG
jgi:putative FmdB family regulatory protein